MMRNIENFGSMENVRDKAAPWGAVIGKIIRTGNIWETIELPRLKQNPNVTKITIIDSETMLETVIFAR